MTDEENWAKSISKERQAPASIRGYCYQMWCAVYAWLNLDENQTLFIEGAEDFDIIEKDNQRTVQVKDKGTHLTLRSDDAINAINNFWQLKISHPSTNIILDYLTSSSIGIEKGSPLGAQGGIPLWQNCRNNSENLEKIIFFLKNDESIQDKLSFNIKCFLNSSSAEEIYNSIIKPINWITNSDTIYGIERLVEDKLVYHGNSHGISPSDSKSVCNRLLKEMFSKASKSDSTQRLLRKVDFFTIFEEETRISLPISFINNKISNTMDSLSKGNVDSTFSLTTNFPLEIIPSICTDIYVRQEHIMKCNDILFKKSVLLIIGATGIGKSTLAKQLANSLSPTDWCWISFGNDKCRILATIMQLYHLLLKRDSTQHIILDNFNIDGELFREYEEILSLIFFQLQQSKRSLIVTAQKDIPNRFARKISLNLECVYNLKAFSEEELLQYVKFSGCPQDQASARTKEIYIHTSGHPQLVHARVISLKQNGWGKIQIDDFLTTPLEVQEEQKQAQQLLGIISINERMLLYLCSVVTNPFYKDDIVSLAKIWKIDLAGDIFDKLEGPYLERTTGNTYHITPLLGNSASNALPPADIEKIHSDYAEILITLKEISIDRASAALMHAFIGQNGRAISWVAFQIMHSPIQIKEVFVEYLGWVIDMKPRDNNKFLFPNNSIISRLLRALQYSLAEIKSPKNAVEIYELWRQELADCKSDSEKMLFYLQGLLRQQVPLSVKCFMGLFVDVYECMNNMEDITHKYSSSFKGFMGLGFEGSLMAINVQRINTLNDYNDYFNIIKTMHNGIRTKILSLFEQDISYIDLVLNKILYNERDAKRSDWKQFLRVLGGSFGDAKTWEQNNICACIVKYMGIIYHDQLNDLDKAARILKKAKKQYPENKDIFSEQLADIYIVENMPEEALKEILTIPPLSPNVHNCLKPRNDIFRKTGRIYGRLEKWNEAATCFINAADFAEKEKLYIEQAALLGDAALAYWYAKSYEGMNTCLNKALKIIRPHFQGNKDIKALTTLRMIALIVKRISYTLNNELWEDNCLEPWVGICSNSEPNARLTELPEISIESALILLGTIELILDLPIYVLQHQIDMTSRDKPINNMWFTQFKIFDRFRDRDYTELPKLTFELIYFMVAGKKTIDSGVGIQDKIEYSISDEEVCRNACFNDIIIYLMYSAVVSMLADTIDASIFKCWREIINRYPIDDKVTEVLTAVEVLSKAPYDILLDKMESGSNNSDRLAASIFLLKSQEPSPHQMIQINIYLYLFFSHNDNGFGQLPEKTLSYLISRNWISKTNSSFLFNNPKLHIPQILEICKYDEDSYSKIGKLLLHTSSAINCTLPIEVQNAIKN